MTGTLNERIDLIENGFGGGQVLVVGDLMLDRYLWGEVGRISPEAPVPVVRLIRRSEVAGGAANVATNLAKLGCRVSLGGIVGLDEARESLIKILAESGIDTAGMVSLVDRCTITKTRIIGGHQQMLRLDDEDVTPVGELAHDALAERILPLVAGSSVVVLSDYAKGTLSDELIGTIIAVAEKAGVPILIDPKGRDYSRYHGATAITPNLRELSEATGVSTRDIDGLLEAGQKLRIKLDIHAMIVTQGEHGMSLLDDSGVRHFPAVAREVFDVSGAGDTVIATIAASMAGGVDLPDAIRLANIAAGIVVGKVGTAPIEKKELVRALTEHAASEQEAKICTLAELQRRVEGWRARGEQIVFTNGCFDIMHVGHVTYLEQAKRQGHRLIIGLNTDQSVRRLKGPSRPIVAEQDRARVLAGLSSVDAVVLFDDETPLNLILSIRPDVLVKGNDYTEDQVVGAREVKADGGRVSLIPVVSGRSTTDIVTRIKASA